MNSTGSDLLVPAIESFAAGAELPGNSTVKQPAFPGKDLAFINLKLTGAVSFITDADQRNSNDTSLQETGLTTVMTFFILITL